MDQAKKMGTLFRGWTMRPMPVYAWAHRAKPSHDKVHPVNRISKWTIVRGDKVAVVDGAYKGQSGKVQVVLRSANRLIVEGVNVGTRMLYVQGDEDRKTRAVQAPRSIHYSNVQLVCPMTGLPTRISRKYLEDGTRVRVARRSGALIPMPEVLKERHRPRRTAVGPHDTLEDEVLKVTYDPVEDRRLWMAGPYEQPGKPSRHGPLSYVHAYGAKTTELPASYRTSSMSKLPGRKQRRPPQ